MALTVSVDEIVASSNNSVLRGSSDWKRIRLGEVASIQNGGPFDSALFSKSEGHQLIRIRDITRTTTETRFNGEFDPCYIVNPGDLLVGMDGDFNCARWKGQQGLLNQRVCCIRLESKEYDERFLDHVLPSFLKAINDATSSVTVKHLSSRTVADIPLPCPPLEVQQAIAGELDKQFSLLDEAVAGLQRVKANLKRYKAAALKSAVTGRLVPTEADLARCEGRNYETGAQLLQRILETRRSQWQGKGKYKEPAAPDTTDLPELPEGWVWATVDQLLASLRNGLSKKPEDSEPGTPILRISAVRPLALDTTDHRYYLATAAERTDDYRVGMNDLLFVRYNGTKELVGACACVGAIEQPLLYPDKLIRGRVVSQALVRPSYVAVAANVGESRRHVDDLIKTTAGQQGIAGGEIKQMPIPLPPLSEQHRIVAEIDRLLSIAREAEADVDANLKRAQGLRQAILDRAFSSEPDEFSMKDGA